MRLLAAHALQADRGGECRPWQGNQQHTAAIDGSDPSIRALEEALRLALSGASEEQLTMWISEGAFEPRGARPEEWQFSSAALRRVRTANRLARDLEINAVGIALALDLLDEIAHCERS